MLAKYSPPPRRRPVCQSPLLPPSSTPPSDTEVVFVFDANLLSFLSTFLSGVDNFVLSLSPLLSLADPSRPSVQVRRAPKGRNERNVILSQPPPPPSRRGRWLPRPIIKLLFSTTAAFLDRAGDDIRLTIGLSTGLNLPSIRDCCSLFVEYRDDRQHRATKLICCVARPY